MESIINLRKKLNDCNDLLQKIAFLNGEKIQSDQQTRNNNIFFNAFDEYVKLIISYGVIKKFKYYEINLEDSTELLRITNQIINIFDTKQTNKSYSLQNSIKKINDRLQSSWLEYSENLTIKILDKLEIFVLICNNKKEIKDIINSIKGINEWPLNEEKYNKYIENYNIAIEKIKEIHFDEEIANFLKKIKNRSATLLDLNDKVLTWIKENKLSGNILLYIKLL